MGNKRIQDILPQANTAGFEGARFAMLQKVIEEIFQESKGHAENIQQGNSISEHYGSLKRSLQ